MRRYTPELKATVIAAWNVGDRSSVQIAASLGLEPLAVHSIVSAARRSGVIALRIDPHERSRRAAVSARANPRQRGPGVPRDLERLRAIVARWNLGKESMAQLGVVFGMPRGSIGRLLGQARELGMRVVSIDPWVSSRRAQAAYRANRAAQRARLDDVWQP